MSLPDIDWEEVQWDDLIPRLMLYTAGRLHGGMRWRNKYNGSIPGGYEIEDFIHGAIEKTILGIRKWNPEEKTLFQHLIGVISSEINHLSEKEENRLSVDSNDVFVGAVDQQIDFRLEPEQAVIIESERAFLLEYLCCIDPQLKQLAELMFFDGLEGSIEISNKLGISVRAVNNLKKRLYRAVTSYSQNQPLPPASPFQGRT